MQIYQGQESLIRISSSFLLHYAQSFTETTVVYETGKGNKKRFINMNNITEKFSQEECSALLGLHAFTGRDTSSAYKGIGKIKPIKLLQKNAKINNMLARLGDNWEVSDYMFSDAEELTCAFYGKPRFKRVNELRFHLLKATCGSEDKITNNRNVGISNMLPCSDSMREHVQRINYKVCDLETSMCNKTRCAKSINRSWMDFEGQYS